METIAHHAPLEHSVRRMRHLARNAQPTPSLVRGLVHAQTVSLGQPLIRWVHITIITAFHLPICMYRVLPHAHSIVVQVSLLTEITALLAPLGHSARPMLLCAHLAWLTHFLDLEPVRAHPVSPEQHLFCMLTYFYSNHIAC